MPRYLHIPHTPDTARTLTLSGLCLALKGIPYALPPVGALRWKAPVAMADGDKVIDATEFGLSCR